MAKARFRQALLPLVLLLLGGVLLAVPSGAVKQGSAAPAAAMAATGCGTTAYYKANGARWHCSFADEFSGTAVNANKWRAITSWEADWGRRTDCFVSGKDSISVSNGTLKLTTRRGLAPFSCGPASRRYTATATSATLTTFGKYSQRYGRVQIRARFPYTKVPGLQSALWMWPQDPKGAMLGLDGEIDIAEYYSKYWDRVIPYLHYPTSFLSPSQATNNYCMVWGAWNWHTYVLEWTPEAIVIKYDNKVCLRKNSGGSPFNKHYFMSLTQSLGVGKNAPVSQTPKRATMQVDYVRMWY